MCRRIILTVILLLITINAYPQNFDGNVWESLTDDGKFVLLCGIMQGEYVVRQVLFDMDEKAILEVVDKKLYDGRLVMDIIKEIDDFYTLNPDKKYIIVGHVYLKLLEAHKNDR